MAGRETRYRDCYFAREGETVVLGNSRIERAWKIGRIGLGTVRFVDKLTGRDWALNTSFESRLTTEGGLVGLGEMAVVDVSAEVVQTPVSEGCLRVRFALESGGLTRVEVLRSLPRCAGDTRVDRGAVGLRSVESGLYAGGGARARPAWRAGGVRRAARSHRRDQPPGHRPRGRSHRAAADGRQQPLHRDRGRGRRVRIQREPGPKLAALSPLLRFRDNAERCLPAWGRDSTTCLPGRRDVPMPSRSASTPAGATAAFSRSRSIKPRDISSCRSGTSSSARIAGAVHHVDIDEAKMIAEVEAAAELGITAVAVDAGWTRHIMGGEPDPEKFPHGFEPLIRRARELGVKLELWTVPNRVQRSARRSQGAPGLDRPHQQPRAV